MIRSAILSLCLLSLLLCRRAIVVARSPAEEATNVASLSSSSSSSSSCRSEVLDDGLNAVAAVAELRGGGSAVATATSSASVVDYDEDDGGVDRETRDAILRFLERISSLTNANDDGIFRIQGWRWHFMSLMRDSRRLERLAVRLQSSDDDDDEEEGLSALERAADYVVNFNMAGLFRIESGMFVDFLREHLCDDGGGEAAAATDAFRRVVGKVDEHRVQSERIGRELYARAKEAASSSGSSTKSSSRRDTRQKLLDEVTQSSRRLTQHLSSMRNIQETLIVPAISRTVPSKVQSSFNSKVLLKLGLLESRVHLVGMHDAVWESGNAGERRAFEEEIPYVARVMIERWRRSLYLPKAGALDYGLNDDDA